MYFKLCVHFTKHYVIFIYFCPGLNVSCSTHGFRGMVDSGGMKVVTDFLSQCRVVKGQKSDLNESP